MFEMLKNIISRQLGVDPEDIEESTRITEDLGADSLDVVEMVMSIEEECGVAIPDEAVPTLVTVGDVVNYVENQR